jgi:hypothetical protein
VDTLSQVSLFMCVCVCVCVYIYIYIHTHTQVCYICIYIYTHTHTSVCVCVCVCVRTHTHTHTHTGRGLGGDGDSGDDRVYAPEEHVLSRVRLPLLRPKGVPLCVTICVSLYVLSFLEIAFRFFDQRVFLCVFLYMCSCMCVPMCLSSYVCSCVIMSSNST